MKENIIHIGKHIIREPIRTCFECNEHIELWMCDRCGRDFCEKHIIEEGNGIDDISFICVKCQEERADTL